jgi:hypothetical protein
MRCYTCKKEIVGKKHTTKDYTGKRRIVCDTCFQIVKLFEFMDRAKRKGEIFGGIDKKMFWDEYLEYKQFPEKIRKRLERLKAFIERKNLFGLKGYEYQEKFYEKWHKQFGLVFSLRAWGDFMAAIMNSKEGERKYDYVSFAW